MTAFDQQTNRLRLKSLLWCLFTGWLIVCSGLASAAPAKKRVVSAPRPAVKKMTDSELLARQLALSTLFPDEPLSAPCGRTKFQYLATAMAANESLLSLEKGEFEPDADYQKRATQLAHLMADKPVVFCEYLDDNPDVPFAYDTEANWFAGSFNSRHNVWRDEKQLGSYKTRTRMGIPVTVKSSVEWNYNIDFSVANSLPGCLTTKYDQSSFKASIPLEQAAAVKRYGKIAFSVRLEPPYVTTSERPGSPTLDDPYDVYSKTTEIHGRLQTVAIIDAQGAVVWKCEAGRLNPNQPPRPANDQETWVSVIDYPTEGYLRNLRGRVEAILGLDDKGQPRSCTITSSSGHAVLDNATCAAWMKRAKFIPAGDIDGIPTDSEFKVVKVWP